MEDGDIKSNKKNKTGPLKSSPGFLKCMRNVYLYFKEEKEKGALNIPINSFIERTAVACGVGRKTLYNYAKKGLFDEDPMILQPNQKKTKKAKRRIRTRNYQMTKKRRKEPPTPTPPQPPDEEDAGPSEITTERVTTNSVVIQPDGKAMVPNENLCMQAVATVDAVDSNGYEHCMIAPDPMKAPHIQLVQGNKIHEATIVPGAWFATTPAAIKREVDYYPDNNI